MTRTILFSRNDRHGGPAGHDSLQQSHNTIILNIIQGIRIKRKNIVTISKSSTEKGARETGLKTIKNSLLFPSIYDILPLAVKNCGVPNLRTVKSRSLPRESPGSIHGALAQMVARDIRIVEVRGSTPLCSTRKPCRSKPARFFCACFSSNQSMQILHGSPWGIPQGFSFALCGPETGFRIKTPISSSGRR